MGPSWFERKGRDEHGAGGDQSLVVRGLYPGVVSHDPSLDLKTLEDKLKSTNWTSITEAGRQDSAAWNENIRNQNIVSCTNTFRYKTIRSNEYVAIKVCKECIIQPGVGSCPTVNSFVCRHPNFFPAMKMMGKEKDSSAGLL